MLRTLFLIGVIALTTPVAHAAPARCLAGQYRGDQTELVAELILASDGRFRYGLSYGALDERAQGRWESDGTQVFLDSDPVTPPSFTLLDQSPAGENEFRLKLDLPDGISPQYFNALAVLSDGRFVYYGREGDIIDGRYRVVRIGDESIELEYADGRGKQTIRLSGS